MLICSKTGYTTLGRMPERRMLFQFGIAYKMSPHSLLYFEVAYFVPDWDQARPRFVTIQAAFNCSIHAAFVAEASSSPIRRTA